MAVSSVSSSERNRPYSIIKVSKKRMLPLPGKVLVNAGDKVEPETIVAKIDLKPGIPWVIPVARLIGVRPDELEACVLVKVGDKVQQKQVIARATEKGIYGRKEYEAPIDGIVEDISYSSGRITIREEFGKEEPPLSFDAAFELRCKPKDLPQYMLKKVGDEVKRGQIIAKKGDQAAYTTTTALAPISGVISEINAETGFVTIARPFKEVTVNAYITGTVTEVIKDRGVVVETPAALINGVFGVGGERHGELRVLAEDHTQPLTEDMITEDLAGKVIVGGSFATNEAIAKALQCGVKGIITATASYLNLVKSLGVKLGVGITGQEDIDMTLILMEGFGTNLNMRPEVFAALKALDGKQCSINGKTQIRAGAIRPEIIVPFPDYDGELDKVHFVDEDLKLGQQVRVINHPWFGQLGEIVEIVRENVQIGSEARVPVVKVKLQSGEVVTVARKNVEGL